MNNNEPNNFLAHYQSADGGAEYMDIDSINYNPIKILDINIGLNDIVGGDPDTNYVDTNYVDIHDFLSTYIPPIKKKEKVLTLSYGGNGLSFI